MALGQQARDRLELTIGDKAVAKTLADKIDSLSDNTSTTFAVFGVTPVVRAAAYTQTYATAARTVPNATYSAVTIGTVATSVAKTNSSPYGFSSGDADKVVTFCGAVPTDLTALNVALAALAADVILIKQVVGALIDDLQGYGFAQ